MTRMERMPVLARDEHLLTEPIVEPRQPLCERRGGMEAQVAPRLAHVGEGLRHITRLLRSLFDHGLPLQLVLNGRDQLTEHDRTGIAQVVELVARPGRAVHRGANTVHDVVHIGVVAPGAAIAELQDGLARADLAEELVDGQVGPLARKTSERVMTIFTGRPDFRERAIARGSR